MSEREILYAGDTKLKTPGIWNRRQFLQVAATTSVLRMAGSRFAMAQNAAPFARFAYLGTHDALHVYRLTGQGWIEQQTLPTARPAAIAIANGHLYAANEVAQFRNLPCGSVEAYAIDASTGRLQAKNQVGLSLSAIMPRDLAVAPDGRSLLVAAHGGGAYNLLPIKEDGSLGKVSSILKSIGSGPNPEQASANPAAIVFDSACSAIAADQGSDTLHTLSLSDGALLVTGHHSVAPGSGPSALVLHPQSDRLYVANALMGKLSSFRYDSVGKLALLQTVQAGSTEDTTASLAIHPAGHALYSAVGGRIEMWKLAHNGTPASHQTVTGLNATKLLMTVKGDALFALTCDAVVCLNIEPASGVLHEPVKVVSIAKPLSMALLS